MRSFNSFSLAGLVVLAGCPVVSRADDLSLSGDARLTGAVRSINGEGVVALKSELSPDPVLLNPDAVRKITFDTVEPTSDLPGGLVELLNGDLLPAVIKEFDGKTLNVATPDAGSLAISRHALKSMQLGVHRQKAIYSGPRTLEEWTRNVDGVKNWRFSKGVLSASGPAVASRRIDVPSRFVFKFSLKWKMSPGFTIYFADPLAMTPGKVDRYYFQFSSSGIDVKRESRTGSGPQNVITLSRGPEEFPSNQVDVELRVDRKTSRIHLLLDGEPEASGVDPVPDVPLGSGFTFISSSPAGTPQEISRIEVLDFDNSRERHHSEDRGDSKTDSMISRDDDRWGGHLTGVHQGPDGTVLTFRSDFQEQPLELLESDVSTVFFALPETGGEAPANQDPWILKLRGGGSLHVAACTFSENSVTATHPLLGPLEIDRAGVTALERQVPANDGKEEK